jgi:hypothetical protein
MPRAIGSASAAPSPSHSGAGETGGNRRLLWLTIGLIGAVLFFKDHHLTISQIDSWAVWSVEGASAAGGNVYKGMALSLLAVLGLYLLRRPATRRLAADNVLAWLALGCCGWCLASIFWSGDPGRTARQGAVLIFYMIAALGIARQFTPRDLVTIVLALGAGYAAVGVGVELCLGTFQPWQGEYRFAGTVHPNVQSVQLAFLCLAASCALWGGAEGRRKHWLLALLGIGVVLLLLTKSRTSCLGLLAALAAVWSVRAAARPRLLAGLGIAAAAALTVFFGSMLSEAAQDRVADVVLLGRREESAELTGRIPIWNAVAPYVDERPWTGHGYESFWTLERIEDVSNEILWQTPHSHNQYLDAVLTVGLIGAAAIAACALLGAIQAAALLRRSGDYGYALILGLLVYSLFTGATESGKLGAELEALLLGCGLAQVAFVRPENKEAEPS